VSAESTATLRDLRGKVAIVTGASRGVGAATAVALAEQGCAVVCAARATAANPLRLPGTIDETVARIEAIGGDALAIPTNLVVEDDIVRMVAQAASHFGRVDLLVNNAAITFIGDLSIPLKRYQLVMDVNVRAPLIATREVAPHLRAAGGGSILNVSSAAAMVPIPGMMAYGMSKLALEHLTLDAARELHPDNVCVNCFRIDVSVASEGYVANAPAAEHATWEPTEVAAEGIVWMLRQVLPYSGRRESMQVLRAREGIMASRVDRGNRPPIPTELVDGLYLDAPFTTFVDG
jgi:NAD(P)-dependent dehydrogenase (short-subunit alcohol dehydrogenase family)